ncbi:MAG: biotin-dependent carboxyltransferase family protein [Pseudomonadales bacterium]|nr:biotin-dependent carboxyltransferase family protein [Pseudomonadales bacterium]
MKPVLQVLKPGLQTLFIDGGRKNHQHLGLTASGPMDEYAYRWANRLLHNSENSPCLEISFGFFKCEILSDCQLVITGANFHAKLNNRSLKNWQTFNAKKGDYLSFSGPKMQGTRAYLSLQGGFFCPSIFSSCCTVEREHLGGQQQGKALQKGEIIKALSPPQTSQQRFMPASLQPEYNNHQLLKCRFISGSQWPLFTREQQKKFLQQHYKVSNKSNRMGFRLSGEPIQTALKGIISEGITLGAIQIPADGQPIVLLRDRQTIGGYPKLGNIIAVDIEKIAQAMPGQKIQFIPCDINTAYDLRCLREEFFRKTI